MVKVFYYFLINFILNLKFIKITIFYFIEYLNDFKNMIFLLINLIRYIFFHNIQKNFVLYLMKKKFILKIINLQYKICLNCYNQTIKKKETLIIMYLIFTFNFNL